MRAFPFVIPAAYSPKLNSEVGVYIRMSKLTQSLFILAVGGLLAVGSATAQTQTSNTSGAGAGVDDPNHPRVNQVNQREQNQQLEKRLRTLSDQLSQLERDFGDRMSREVQSLHDEMKRRNEELHRTVEKMFGELANVKTDRTLLAGLFVEVAKCLNLDSGGKGGAKIGGDAARGWPAG